MWVPAWRGWHRPRSFLESPVSHPRPPAQPFSCLPSRCRQPAALLSVGTPRQSPGEPSRYRASSLTHGRLGEVGNSSLFARSPPLALPVPVTATSRRRDAAARPSLHSPSSQPRSHRTRARTPGTNPLRCCPGSSPRDSPLPRAAGSPGGFQGGPCPCPHTRTHSRRPPNDRQGLEKGWGVFTVPRAASAGPDAAPGRRHPPPSRQLCPGIPTSRRLLPGKLRHGEGAPLREYRQSVGLLPSPGR